MEFAQCEMVLDRYESPTGEQPEDPPSFYRDPSDDADHRAQLLAQREHYRHQTSLAASVGAATENHFLCCAVEAELDHSFPDWRNRGLA